MDPSAYLITGVQAAGKSTVAEALARRFDAAVHVHGDLFRRWIVRGREDMTPDAGPEAHRQLRLRHRLTADAADTYWRAGFTVVVQDVILGGHLDAMITAIRARPLHVAVLDPGPDVVAAREQGRGKTAYGPWQAEPLVAVLREHTPRRGTWIDSTHLDVEQTVDAVLATPPL